MHQNKTAFRFMHAKHHEQRAALDVMSSGYMAVAEGLFSCGLPMTALYGLGAATGNWWYAYIGGCSGVWGAGAGQQQ